MLQFTDLNDIFHMIHIHNVNHVQFRKTPTNTVVSFHFNGGQHVVPATVDIKTAERILKELGELK